MLPRLATIDIALRSFQYEICSIVLFLNTKLYTFRIANIALCSICKALEETPAHNFYDQIHFKDIIKSYNK